MRTRDDSGLSRIATLTIQLVLVLAVSGLLFWYVASGFNKSKDAEPNTDTKAKVTSFQECVKAGNPIMESYPQQCNHEGQNFVEEIETNTKQ